MCILCSVLVALEAVEVIRTSLTDLNSHRCVYQFGLYICQTYTVLKGYIYIGKKSGLYHGYVYK